jgi:hypothetical protein
MPFHNPVALEDTNILVYTHDTEKGSAAIIKNTILPELHGYSYTLLKDYLGIGYMILYIPTLELQEHIIDIIRENPDTFQSYQIKGGAKIILNEIEEEEEYDNHSSILTPNLNLTTQKEWEGIAKGWINDSITTKDVLNTEVVTISSTSVVVNDTDTVVVNDTDNTVVVNDTNTTVVNDTDTTVIVNDTDTNVVVNDTNTTVVNDTDNTVVNDTDNTVVVNDTDTTKSNTKGNTTDFNSSTALDKEISEEIIDAYKEYVTEEDAHIKNQEIDNLKCQLVDLYNHVLHLEHVMLATTEHFTQKITALESKNIDSFHKEEKSFKTEILTKLDMIMKHQSHSK